jgi:murein DD-endopeptidase MepM/ murein hydrolase activator NlpD
MQDAAEEASLLQSCRCNRRRRRNRGRRYRWPCFWRGFLRRQTSGQGEQDRKKDGETNHRRVKHEKVALSIKHEIHFRELDCGTFGRFRHRERWGSAILYFSRPRRGEPERHRHLRLAIDWRNEKKVMRRLFVILIAVFVLYGGASAQTESATPKEFASPDHFGAVDLALPTDNDAIFHGGGPDFYQYIERDYHGEKSTPWEGGQYGFVREPVETSSGIVYTRFHEGIDIRCLRRDERGEPLDEVRAIADGKVVYTSLVASHSNYGKYIVIEHRWGGSAYFSLYGHLSKIDIHMGDAVQRGEHIAVMGYTGAGINQARAHVHLELNLMINHNFQGWYDSFLHPGDPNHHGIYNGINLVGLNIARLYLELREKPSLTIPQFLGEEDIFYTVALPKTRGFELAKTYPWMLGESGTSEPTSWIVSFARSGLPLKIEPSDRKVKEPQVTYVKPSSLNASYLTDGIATGPTSHPHLTDHGKQLMQLYIFPQ